MFSKSKNSIIKKGAAILSLTAVLAGVVPQTTFAVKPGELACNDGKNFSREFEEKSEDKQIYDLVYNTVTACINFVNKFISKLEEDVSKLEEDVSKLEEDISKLEEDISKVEEYMSKVQEAQSKVDEAIYKSLMAINKVIVCQNKVFAAIDKAAKVNFKSEVANLALRKAVSDLDLDDYVYSNLDEAQIELYEAFNNRKKAQSKLKSELDEVNKKLHEIRREISTFKEVQLKNIFQNQLEDIFQKFVAEYMLDNAKTELDKAKI